MGAVTVNPVQTSSYYLNVNANPITFGAATNIDVAFVDAVFGSNAVSWNVTNYGSIQGAAGFGLSSPGSMVTNSGTISGAGWGVYLTGGGTVNNENGGRIGGGGDEGASGVSIFGGIGTVTNAGTISATGTYSEGVRLGTGGTVKNTGAISATGNNSAGVGLEGGAVYNQSGGQISGAVGIFSGGTGAVTNAGAITGGVGLWGGGTVINQSGGTISSSVDVGVYITGGSGAVTNAGTISGADSVKFEGSGANTLTLETGSVLTGEALGSFASATNALILEGTGEADNNFEYFNTLTVEASGIWTLGGDSAFWTTNLSSGTLNVTGDLTTALTQAAGAIATVASGGTLELTWTLAGTVSGAGTLAMALSNEIATIDSGAQISVSNWSIGGVGTEVTLDENLTYAGAFTQGARSTTAITAGDSLSLTGTASLSGIMGGAGTFALAGGTATIDKGATITASTWMISGAGTDVTLDENLTYAGSFSEAAGDTLVLSGGHLLLNGADTFTGGTVDGSMLLETEGTTTVSGLTIGGTVEWRNTEAVTQSGGTVTIGDLSGDMAFLSNTSTGTYDIADNSGIDRGNSSASDIKNAGLFEKTGGTKTSTIAPSVANTGTIEVSSGTLDFGGAVTGAGTDTILGASTLEFDSTLTAGQTIGFSGSGGALDLTDPLGYAGAHIKDFGASDTIDLSGDWNYLHFSENSGLTVGTLTLTNGTNNVALKFAGDYSVNDFNITPGTTITKIAYA
jgi:hypothetical protein